MVRYYLHVKDGSAVKALESFTLSEREVIEWMQLDPVRGLVGFETVFMRNSKEGLKEAWDSYVTRIWGWRLDAMDAFVRERCDADFESAFDSRKIVPQVGTGD
jgi:hypothetical protein